MSWHISAQILVARKMSQFNKTLYRDIFLAPRLLPHKKAITSALYQRTHVKLSIHNCLKNVPCLCAGCPTEYGENITSSQAKPIQAISSGVACFFLVFTRLPLVCEAKDKSLRLLPRDWLSWHPYGIASITPWRTQPDDDKGNATQLLIPDLEGTHTGRQPPRRAIFQYTTNWVLREN